MILVRTPLRISFVGGRTDLRDFYTQYIGRVISTSIDKSIYITVSDKFEGDVRVSYSKIEMVKSSAEIKNTRAKAVMDKLGIEKGVQIVSIGDLPGEGIGLASSSAFTVGLLNGLHQYKNNTFTNEQLAEESCEIEIDTLGAKIGKQDQYAVACGGLNLIEFNKDESVNVIPIKLSQRFQENFENHLMFFYTNKTRSATSLLDSEPQNFESLKRISDIVPIFHEALVQEDLRTMGELLNETWLIKRELKGGISSSDIDYMYDTAIKNGAWGGKLLGAGGGGFLMIFAPPESHGRIRTALKDWREVDFKFTNKGSEIVYQD